MRVPGFLAAILRLPALTAGLVVRALTGIAAAHDGHDSDPGRPNFGAVHFPISCGDTAQARFNEAVAMIHSFYPYAPDVFRSLIDDHPSCAMAYWGLAISERGNPLIKPVARDAMERAAAAMTKARKVKPGSAREKAWIDAFAVYFRDYRNVDQHRRAVAYEAAMQRLSAAYPNDVEAKIFYALAINEAIDLMDMSYARQLKAGAILEKLQPLLPDHPGIPHYIIHSYEFAPLAEKGLAAARRYAAIAPASPHALHMPSHVFSTLGMWREAISSDRAADDAALTLARRGPDAADRPERYHSLDFLAYAYLNLAQDKQAKAIVDLRNEFDVFPASFFYSGHNSFAMIPARFALERGDWQAAAQLHVPKTPFPQSEMITWFARALGAARKGELDDARRNLGQVTEARRRLEAAKDAYWARYARIYEDAVSAWIAAGQDRRAEAQRLMRRAADVEDRTEKTIAMENRLVSMRTMLGELQLVLGAPTDALANFRISLKSAPNRFRTLAGAAEAARLSGAPDAARNYYTQLMKLTDGADTVRPEMQSARDYLAGRN